MGNFLIWGRGVSTSAFGRRAEAAGFQPPACYCDEADANEIERLIQTHERDGKTVADTGEPWTGEVVK